MIKSSKEIDLIEAHSTYNNPDKVRNLESCNGISKQSVTLKYQLMWGTTSNESLDTIRKNFKLNIANAQVKGEMRNELFQSTLGICVHSVRDPMRIDDRPESMLISLHESSMTTIPTSKP